MSIAVNPIVSFELGEMYEHDNTTPIDIVTVNVWVTAKNMTEGLSRVIEYNDVTGDTYLEIPTGEEHDGYYWITWTVSAIGHQGDTYEFGIMINSTMESKTIARAQQGINGTITMSGTALVDMTNLDEIRGAARDITGANDITVVHSDISVVRI